MRLLLLITGTAAASGCSLFTTDFTSCDVNADCRGAFGIGSVCAADGFCEQPQRFDRCEKAFPSNLLDDPLSERDRIVIGNLMDRSSTTHRARENSAELALGLANDEGGVAGREFGVVFCTIEENLEIDGLSRQEAAVASARYLVDVIGVPAIIGPAASGDTQSVFQELDNNGDDVLVISPSATSNALTDLEPDPSDASPGLLWRTAPPDEIQGAAIVSDMLSPGDLRLNPVTNVAVVFEAGAYGDGLANGFAAAFQAQGGTVTLLRFDGDGQRSEAVTQAGLGNAEEVLFISSQKDDVIAFLNAATVAGFDDKSIFLTDGGANDDVLSNADPMRFPQVRGTRPAPLDENADLVYANFLVSYSSGFGESAKPFSFTANAYDAAWLVGYGTTWAHFQEAGVVSGTNIARGLRRLSSGEAIDILPTSWNTVQNRFESGNGINVRGASGALDYDPVTEETVADIEVWRIANSQITGIYVFEQ